MKTSDAQTADPADPYARQAQIFPQLNPQMVARVGAYGAEETIAKGTVLFQRGDRSIDCFLILRGSLEVFDNDEQGSPHVFVTQGPNQFTGEVDLFNERKILVSARAGTDSVVVRIKRPDFQRLLTNETDIAEIMMRAFILRRVALIQHADGGVTLVGAAHDGKTLELQRFLTRNGYPHRLLDTETDEDAKSFLDQFALKADALPAILLDNHEILKRPDVKALADALGLTEVHDPDLVHDLAIVGAGPAGLAAAVYAASEGLNTIVVEGVAPGGQAGTSSKIENYLGFPTGISGQALAGRAQIQAQKFGAKLAVSRHVTGIDCTSRPFVLNLDDGLTLRAKAVVVASGARYRKLDVANFDRFEGQGIHYAATAMEQKLCGDEEVIVVGGGNSAGQAAIFLAQTTGHVHILVRGPGLAATMSDYLVQRIDQNPKITLYPFSEITALNGDERLSEVSWTNRQNNQVTTIACGNVFSMIGAEPNTAWLHDCLALDGKGFVKTGVEVEGQKPTSAYATSLDGVFAVGDVRSGSVKRVASGVGEGSVVVQAIHQFLNPG